MDINFDVIALTEIGKCNVDNCAGFFENYVMYHDPSILKMGGAAVLIHENIELIDIRNDLDIKKYGELKDSTIENIWLECKHQGIERNIVIGVIYRHPNSAISEFTILLEQVLHKLSAENKIVFIMGDLNSNVLNTTHHSTTEFLEKIFTENFIPHITVPTRITQNTITLIDHILIKIDRYNIEENIISGNLVCDISDHLPNIVLYGDKQKSTRENCRKYVRIYSEKNINRFQACLGEDCTWDELQTSNNCNEVYDIYVNKVNLIYNECFPLKMLSRKRSKDKKWVTTAIKKSCTTKSKLYRKFLKKPTENNHRKYKRYKNLLSKVCQEAQVNYFHNLVDNSKQSIKQLWKTFGPIINPKTSKKNSKIIDKLRINNNISSNTENIANHFNDYFCNIGLNLADKIPAIPNINHKQYMTQT